MPDRTPQRHDQQVELQQQADAETGWLGCAAADWHSLFAVWVAEASCLVVMLDWAEGAGAGRQWGAVEPAPIGPGGRGLQLAGVAIAELFEKASEEAVA